MCGIVAIQGNVASREQRLTAMLAAQKHRGPDATQMWSDTNISLGHNRLSIIDLTETANQPMHSACGRYVLVFNGEIYNYLELKATLSAHYTFVTQSDTEVLLAAYAHWGKNMLPHLNGMFSLLIWDKKAQTLFAARDRFGVKPLYYAAVGSALFVASELKTLWAGGVPKVKNKQTWASYLRYGTYGNPNDSFWEHCWQLPAGHYIEWQAQQDAVNQQPTCWYDFGARIQQLPKLTEAALFEEYQACLASAIQWRFRADVPLGMAVSGGLDSSILIDWVHRNLPHQQAMEAFTFYTGNDQYDELPWASKLLQQTPYRWNQVLLTAAEVPDLMKKVALMQDEPFGGIPTLAYGKLFETAKNRGIKVMLDGQGIDEAWAGYDYYHTASNHLTQGTTQSPLRPEVLDANFMQLATPITYPTPFDSAMQNKQYRDLFYTKLPRALRFNDRISMMHGVELREPFLDYRLVELAFAQADDRKWHNGQRKFLLRKWATQWIGKELVLAPKRPVQTPQREWLAVELKEAVEPYIVQFANFDFVDKKAVLACWADYQKGKQENSFYLWQWINAALLE
jgi:asparagine synthase (glutamine-hydrolysing)